MILEKKILLAMDGKKLLALCAEFGQEIEVQGLQMKVGGLDILCRTVGCCPLLQFGIYVVIVSGFSEVAVTLCVG